MATRRDEDFAEELQAHLTLETDRLIAEGMSPDDARGVALRGMGNVTRVQERFYEARRVRWLDDLRRDLRYACRLLRRSPGFAAVAVLTLALGIGAPTAIFSVVNAVLLRPLPYKDADRLVEIVENSPGRDRVSGAPLRLPGMDASELDALVARAGVLSHGGVYASAMMTAAVRDEPTRWVGSRLSRDLLTMLGAEPILGRLFDATEERPGASGVLLLSYTAWQRDFAGNPNVLGQRLTLDGQPHVVIGVMPRGFQFPDAQTQCWLPWVPIGPPPTARAPRPRLPHLARLRDGVSMQAATEAINVVLPHLRGELPRPAAPVRPSAPAAPAPPFASVPAAPGAIPPAPPPPLAPGPAAAAVIPPAPPAPAPPASSAVGPAAAVARSSTCVAPGAGAIPPAPPRPVPPATSVVDHRAESGPPRFELLNVQEELVRPVRTALLVLAVAVAFVLLIACVNMANLLLARSVARQREIAVRGALGAGRARLIRQALTESVLLALLGGAVGCGLAFGGVTLFRALAATLARRDIRTNVEFPRLDEIGVDSSMLIVALVVSLLAGVLFGLAPALRESRVERMDVLRDAMGSATPSGFSLFRRHRLQGLLVIAEIAMALMLFVSGALLMRSFVMLSRVDPGYDASHVLTFQMPIPRGQQAPPVEALLARLRALPQVRAAGYANALPMVLRRQITPLHLSADSPYPPGQAPPFGASATPELPNTQLVSEDWLKVMGIRVLEGRGFEVNDRAGQPPVMLINQTLARSGYLSAHPIGRQVYTVGPTPWTIVGIVEDVRQLGLDQEPDPQVFIDYRQMPGARPEYYAIRTTGSDPAALAPSLRGIVRQIEPRTPIDNVATMASLVSNSLSRPRLYAVLLASFAGGAVALALVGIYGVIAYAVTQRTREIGIRVALGAARRDILRLVLGQSLVLIAAGLITGLAGAVAVTRYLRDLLFGLTPLDPPTFIAVTLLFLAVATLATLVPARRATRVDPLVAFRCE